MIVSKGLQANNFNYDVNLISDLFGLLGRYIKYQEQVFLKSQQLDLILQLLLYFVTVQVEQIQNTLQTLIQRLFKLLKTNSEQVQQLRNLVQQ